MNLSLLVQTPGKMEGKVLEIKLSQFVIGRDPQCHLRPASPLISKRHCAILQKEGKAFLRDFGSTNGSFVNDEPVKGERELHHDDQLKIGPLLFTVRFEADAPASTGQTPAPATKSAVAGKTPPPATKPASKPEAASPAAAPKPAAKTPPPATKPSEAPTPAAATDDVTSPAAVEAPAAPAAKSGAGAGGKEDDDVLAMLMEMADDSTSGEIHRGPDGVPDGSTVMDLKLPETVANAPVKDDKKKDDKKQPTGDTRTAAASILEKMMKRPRS